MFSLGGFSRVGEYEKKTWDVLIIGAGPAGFTAAIYAARFGLETLIISKDLGGNMALTDLIENYSGFPEGISGSELTNRMHEHVKKLGVEIIFDEVGRIDPTDCAYYEGPCKFVVRTKNGKEYKGRTIIIAVEPLQESSTFQARPSSPAGESATVPPATAHSSRARR